MSIKPDRILVHWACAKVKAELPDEQLLRVIVSKLSEVPGISYAEVACAAYKIRKPDLATKVWPPHRIHLFVLAIRRDVL